MKWVALGSIGFLIASAMEWLRQQIKSNMTDECGFCSSSLDGPE